MAEPKIPEGEFFISSQGHWRYGNKNYDEEWLIPTSKIKLNLNSGESLEFGRAITSSGKYTDITSSALDNCFGITLEDVASRDKTYSNATKNVANRKDNDGYETHIIQSGLLRFNKTDFDNCFQTTNTYNIGDKIYVNQNKKFTNNYDSLVAKSYRLVEVGEITNIFGTGNNIVYDLSVNIINHKKNETDTSNFVGTCADNFNLSTTSWGNQSIGIFSWKDNTGKLVPADIETERNVAGLYIGNISASLYNTQIDLVRNGKIYLEAMPSMKIYNSDGSFKEWSNSTQPIGTQYYLEKDGSVSTTEYINNSVNGYSCPIMTYLGTTAEGKYEFYVDIKRPEIRKLEDLHLIKTYTPTITATQNSSNDKSTINEQLNITDLLNYGTVTDLSTLKESLDIKLYVKSSASKYNGYIFYNNWTEIQPGFFHFDTIRSYGYDWDLIAPTSTDSNYYIKMNVQDGFGLAIESGKNIGPIVCNSDFQCKVVVSRFNESKLQLDLAVSEVQEAIITGNSIEKVIKNTDNKKIITKYDLNNHSVKMLGETGAPVNLTATITTSSKASMKRLYDELKFAELNSSITGTDKAANASSETYATKFSNIGNAMQAIFETPLALWNYKVTPTTDKAQLGMIVDRLNERTKSTSTFGSRELNNFDNRADGTKPTYNYSSTEASSIKKFITLLTDTNESGIDNTNAMGMVFKALKETQQRLIDLEAATFGLSSSKITNNSTQDNDSAIDKVATNVNSNSLDFGLNRLVRALSFELFGTANPTTADLEADESTVSKFDDLEKAIRGVSPTKRSAEDTSYLENKFADVRESIDISDLNSKYYSYNDESVASTNVATGWKSSGWDEAGVTDDRNYKFNGIDDALKRIVNKVDILSKMAFLNTYGNSNVAPNTDSLLTFSHTEIIF